MQAPDDERIWTLEHADTGRQDWVFRAHRFSEVRLDDGERTVPLQDHPDTDFLGVRYTPRCRESTCPRIFPQAFRHCPFCGSPLDGQSGNDPQVLKAWWDTVASGFPELPTEPAPRHEPEPRTTSASLDTRSIPLPTGGDFRFMVAGRPARLFAFDEVNCVLWAKRQLSDEWIRLAAMPEGKAMATWVWSAAEGDDGFAVATERSLCWVPLPWRGADAPLADGYRLEGIEVVGGCVRLGPLVVVPIVQDGRLALAWRDAGDTAGWRIEGDIPGWVATVQDPSPSTKAAATWLGKPVKDARGNLYWAGSSGYLACVRSATALDARWMEWPVGHTGRPAYRPMRDINGAVYQLTLVRSPRSSSSHACRMAMAGEQCHRVDGPFLSSGYAAFYESFRYPRHPWDGYPTDNDVFDGSRQNLFPLLGFRADGDSREVSAFVYARCRAGLDEGVDEATRFQADVMFRQSNGATLEFRRGIELSWPSDLQVFPFDSRLYLYGPFSNRLWYVDVAMPPS